MPYDSSGNFTLVPGTIVSDGMTIQPSQHNPPFQDVAGGLSMVFVRDGRAPMTGPVNMNGNRITGLSDGVNDSDAATLGQAGVKVGDFKDTIRTLDSKWLRRNGAAYNVASYPDLAAMLPPQPDAVVWTTINDGLPSSNIISVCASDDKFFAITSNNVYETSRGSISWSSSHSYPTVNLAKIYRFGTRIVLLGTNASNGIGIVIISNDDGATFGSPISVTTTPAVLQDICQGPDYVVVGSGGRTWVSSDLSSWTENASSVTNLLYSVIYFNNMYVAVGDSGSITTSPSASSWTTQTTGIASPLRSVAGIAGRVAAVGEGGVIITSANGTAWTSATSPVTADLYSIAATEAGFLAVGDAGNAVSSDTGTSWVSRPSGSSSIIRSVSASDYNSGEYISGGSGSYISKAEKTLSSQFRVPNDNPTYGWIRALP